MIYQSKRNSRVHEECNHIGPLVAANIKLRPHPVIHHIQVGRQFSNAPQGKANPRCNMHIQLMMFMMHTCENRVPLESFFHIRGCGNDMTIWVRINETTINRSALSRASWFITIMTIFSGTKYGNIGLPTRREFLREILYKNIAINAIQHGKMDFVDTFGDFSRTVEWNALKSI